MIRLSLRPSVERVKESRELRADYFYLEEIEIIFDDARIGARHSRYRSAALAATSTKVFTLCSELH